MAGWYVRRAEKVAGPIELAKLKELAAAGKLHPTDQLAKDAAGPWTEAGHTTLFANPSVSNLPEEAAAGHPLEPHPPTIPPVEHLSVQVRPERRGMATTVARDSLAFITPIGRGIQTAWSAGTRSLSTRAEGDMSWSLQKYRPRPLSIRSDRRHIKPPLLLHQFLRRRWLTLSNVTAAEAAAAALGV